MSISKLWIYILIICSFLSALAFINLGKLSFTGLMWIIPPVIGSLLFLGNKNDITPAIGYWVPWMIVIILSTDWTFFGDWQRSIMLLTPFLTCLISTAIITTERTLSVFYKVSFWGILIFFASVFTISLLADIPAYIHTRPSSMTVALAAIIMSTLYYKDKKRALSSLFTAIFTIAFLGSRGAIAALGISFFFTNFKIGVFKRSICLILIVLISYFSFQTEIVQHRFFKGGEGTVTDVINGDFDSSGRFYAWPIFFNEAKKSLWLGHGANSCNRFGTRYIGEFWAHPHNEFLRILFDQGILGLVCFLFGLIMQYITMFKLRESNSLIIRQFSNAACIATAMYFFLLFSQNILLYAGFIGNYLYAIIGGIYGVSKRNS